VAYIDQTQRGNRPLVLSAVALLHVAAGYAIVTGMAVHYVRQVMPVFNATNYPIEKPPPPPPPSQPKAKADMPHTHLDVFRPPIPGLSNETKIVDLPQPPFLPPSDKVIPTEPTPVPTTSLMPRLARPHGNPGLWASTNDYPARDLREGNQGLTRFSLAIGTDGRVESCAVTTSSGFPGLDKATCDNVTRRARFEPATDSSGNRVAGNYSGSIRWVIPQD
jgi:protein TonB